MLKDMSILHIMILVLNSVLMGGVNGGGYLTFS